MSGGLVLVRHAMPDVVPGVSSTLWRLGDSAKEDSVLLAHALPRELKSPVISSGQPKVDETAAVIALRCGLFARVDPRVREVEQPAVWFEGDYRAVAAAYLAGDNRHGWEDHGRVAARFTASVDEALTAPGDGDAVIVNHGLAMSIYLAALRPAVGGGESAATAFDLVSFWQQLSFPDAWRYDPLANEVSRIFNGGLIAD